VPNNRNVIIVVWILSILTSVSYLFSSAVIDTSIISIFSSESSDNREHEVKQSLLDSSNRIIFGSIEGDNEQTLANYSNIFIKTLRDTKQFDFVSNGGSLPEIGSDNPLFSYRYLLSKYNKNISYDTHYIKKSFQTVQKTLRSPFPLANKDVLSRDPTGSWKNYLGSYLAKDQPDRLNGVWFSGDRARALFILAMPKSSSHVERSEKQITLIRNIFQEMLPDADIRLTLSGPAIFAINSRNSIRTETQKLSGLATAAVVLILFFAYRSLRLVILSTIPVATAILIAASCVSLYFGSIHGITLAFGATLLGVIVDYPIHLFSHIRRNKNVSKSIEYCWPTIRLGMITTVVAYSAMAFADFAGLAQLGIFAIIGIITGAITTRWVVPVLIPTQINTERFSTTGILTKQFSNPHKGLTVAIISISILIIIIALLNTQGKILQSDLRQFSSVPDSLIKQYTNLKNDLHIPESGDIILVSAANPEMALRMTEDISKALMPLTQNDNLKSFDAASHYLPSKETQLLRINSLPDSDQLSTSINEAITGMDFRTGYFYPFRDDIVSSKKLKPLTPLDPLAQPGNLLGNKISSLLFMQDEKWISLIPLNGAKDETHIHQVIELLPPREGTKTRIVNTRNELSHLMDQYLNETINRIMIGSVVLLLILGIGLTNMKQFLRVIFPISLGVSVTTAILILITGGLSIFHIVALLLTVGISIDYALFLSKDTRTLHEKQNTLTSIIICAVSTITVFGILGSSDIPVLQAIGKTVSIGVVVAFILSFLLSQSTFAASRTNGK
jgi:predicted exporter